MRQPLVITLRGNTAGLVWLYLDTLTVMPGTIWRVDFAAAHNASGEGVSTYFAVVDGDTEYRLSSPTAITSFSDGSAQTIAPIIRLREGMRFRVAFSRAAVGGPVTGLVSGEQISLDEIVD